MKFQKNPITFIHFITSNIIKFIPVESSQRNYPLQSIIILFYLIDYLILFLFIVSSFTLIHIPIPSSFQPYLTLRLLFNLLFIITKWRLFLLLNKMSMMIIFFVNPDEKMEYGDVVCVLIDVITSIIWGLTIEQRKIHFDSRLLIQCCVVKQIMLNSVFFLLRIPSKEDRIYYNIIICLVSAGWIILDYFDTLYQKRVKRIFIMLDIWVCYSAMVPLTYIFILNMEIDYKTILRISISILILILLSILLFKQQYQFKPPFNINETHSVSDSQLLQYFLDIDDIINSNKEIYSSQFICYHKQICNDPSCFLMIKDQYQINLSPQSLLALYLQHEVRKEARKRELIQIFLIFRFYSSCHSLYNYLTQDKFLFRRQFYRVQRQRKEKKQNKMIEFVLKNFHIQLVDQKVISYLKKFLQVGKKFWLRIFQFKIDAQEFFHDGIQMINMINALVTMEESNLSIINLERIQQLKSFILNWSKESEKTSEYEEEKEVEYDNPMIIISAEKTNFMQVIQINTSVMRDLGFERNEFLNLTIDDFLEPDFRIHHHYYMETKSQYAQFDGEEKRIPYIFLKNKEGYLKFYETIIYTLNDFIGNKWCAFLQPIQTDSATFILDINRLLIGVNQSCLFYGFNKYLYKEVVKQQILLRIFKKKSGFKLQQNCSIFEDNSFVFIERVKLKVINQIYFDNSLYYYVIQIKVSNELTPRSSVRPSGIQNYSLISQNFTTENKSKTYKSIKSFSKLKQIQTDNEFYREQDGKITNIKTQEETFQMKRKNSIQIERKKKTLVLNEEEIQEMRLWENKLDFIENMKNREEFNEYDEPPFKIQDEIIIKPLLEDEYKHFYKIRSETKLPLILVQFKIFFLFTLTLLLIFLILLTVAIYFSLQTKLEKDSELRLITQLSYDQVYLGSLPILQNFPDFSANLSGQIGATINEIEEKYTLLNSLNKEINEISLNGERLADIDEKYHLLMDQFLNSDYMDEIQILDHVISKVDPVWEIARQNTFLKNESDYDEIQKYFTIMKISILLIIFILALFYLTLLKRVGQLQKELVDIFAKLKTSLIKKQYLKLSIYENFFSFNCSLAEEDLINENEQGSDNPFLKSTVNLPSFKIGFVLGLLSLFSVVGYGIGTTLLLTNFENTNNSLVLISEKMYDLTISNTMIWIGLNRFPRRISQIHNHEHTVFAEEEKMSVQLLKVFSETSFDSEFESYFNNLWYYNSCRYLSPDNCELFLHGSLQKGVNQIFNYIKRKFDILMHTELEVDEFRSLRTVEKLLEIKKKYLKEISEIISVELRKMKEVNSLKTEDKVIHLIPCCLLLLLVSGIISYVIIKKRIIEIRMMQKIFTFLPYQELSEIKEFMIYINKRIKEEMH